MSQLACLFWNYTTNVCNVYTQTTHNRNAVTMTSMLTMTGHSYVCTAHRELPSTRMFRQCPELIFWQTWHSLRWMSWLANLFWHPTADDHSGEFTDQSTLLQWLAGLFWHSVSAFIFEDATCTWVSPNCDPLHIFEARWFHAMPSVVHPFSQIWSNYCYDYY